SSNSATNFSSKIIWYQGEAGTLKINANGETLSTQTIVKGQLVNQPADPTAPDGYEFGGWYYDEGYTKPVTFPLYSQGVPIYAKITKPEPNLPSDWLAWDSSSNSYYVSKGTSTLPANLVIPETHNDGTNGLHDVTYIADGTSIFNGVFTQQPTLTSVILPGTLESIGNHAFYGCTGLVSINLSECNSLTSIGENAFVKCAITNIIIPDNVTSIGSGAFSSCSSLTSIKLPRGLTTISSRLFNMCGHLSSINIPEGVTTIDTEAFKYCSALTSIIIPSSVVKIRGGVFQSCTNLQSITFADTSTWYRVDNFSNWNSMTGGTQTDVSNATQNATWLVSTTGYYDYYWYKK
ncbi:MAG: leucine-rich repeat protein, partial [Clostridia bacterium]|nr:leucine-rich repeat protein [Clostridia bacterium]